MQLHFAAAMLSMPDFSARRLITTTYYYHHPSPASAALKLKNYGQKISALELCSALLCCSVSAGTAAAAAAAAGAAALSLAISVRVCGSFLHWLTD